MEQIIFKPLEMNDTYVFDYERQRNSNTILQGEFF
jgi:hypothetical protein